MRSPVARRLRNVLLAVAGRVGRLPQRLATNLAGIDVVYRDGRSVDGSTTVNGTIAYQPVSSIPVQAARTVWVSVLVVAATPRAR